MLRMLREKYGISPKDRKSLNERLPLEEFRRLYFDLGLTIAQIAYIYRTAEEDIRKLKKKYSKSDPAIANHRSRGVNEAKLNELRKAVKFKGIPRI